MILKRNRLFGYLFIIMLISSLRITAAYAGTNGLTQAQAVAWVNSKAGQTLEYPDSGLDDPCFDLICCYYQELGQAIPWMNADPSGGGGDFCPGEWQYTDSPQPGDVAVWLSDDNDHAAIVTEIRGSQMVCAEQNYGGKMYVTVNLHNIDAFTYVRPDFPSSQGSPISGGSRTVSDGDYHIVSALNANMGIDVAGNGSANGTNVQLYNNQIRYSRESYTPISSFIFSHFKNRFLAIVESFPQFPHQENHILNPKSWLTVDHFPQTAILSKPVYIFKTHPNSETPIFQGVSAFFLLNYVSVDR